MLVAPAFSSSFSSPLHSSPTDATQAPSLASNAPVHNSDMGGERVDVGRLAAQCRKAYDFSLANLLHDQAVFYAERFAAEVPGDEALYLLAAAHFHNGEPARAYALLQERQPTQPKARYLLALCCFRLNKLEEAEGALLGPPSEGMSNGVTDSAPGLSEVANGAAGLYLLGQVKERLRSRDQAIECYSRSLDLCPFMWCAFERLSWLVLGTPSKPCNPRVFAEIHFEENRFRDDPVIAVSSESNGAGVAANDVSGTSSADNGVKRRRINASTDNGTSNSERCIPAAPVTPPRKPAASPQKPPSSNGVSSSSHSQGPVQVSVQNLKQAEMTLSTLLCILGSALHALHGFACQAALATLQSLPVKHSSSGYVQDLIARCYFEMAEYKKAAEVYRQCRDMNVYGRMQGLEYYSTALWHLREDVELGCLAQRALQWDKLKPHVWCVVGNGFSVQREHDRAIRCFRRAIQLDNSFTYAYTLCAHEYSSKEQFDKAIEMYERAISIDCRHYNAWWGLGNIYHRQEEHLNARYHFRKALEINTSNGVLRISLGMVYQSLNEPQQALELFQKAAESRQCGAAALYQKCCVLEALGKSNEAIEELKVVRSLAPREPCVHFRLGKAYAKIGDSRKALLHYTIAMDLCGAKDSKDHHIMVSAQMELRHQSLRGPSLSGAGPSASPGQGTPPSRTLSPESNIAGRDAASSAVGTPSPAMDDRGPSHGIAWTPTPLQGEGNDDSPDASWTDIAGSLGSALDPGWLPLASQADEDLRDAEMSMSASQGSAGLRDASQDMLT